MRRFKSNGDNVCNSARKSFARSKSVRTGVAEDEDEDDEEEDEEDFLALDCFLFEVAEVLDLEENLCWRAIASASGNFSFTNSLIVSVFVLPPKYLANIVFGKRQSQSPSTFSKIFLASLPLNGEMRHLSVVIL